MFDFATAFERLTIPSLSVSIPNMRLITSITGFIVFVYVDSAIVSCLCSDTLIPLSP